MEKRFPCEYCSLEFTELIRLERHVKRHIPIEDILDIETKVGMKQEQLLDTSKKS